MPDKLQHDGLRRPLARGAGARGELTGCHLGPRAHGLDHRLAEEPEEASAEPEEASEESAHKHADTADEDSGLTTGRQTRT